MKNVPRADQIDVVPAWNSTSIRFGTISANDSEKNCWQLHRSQQDVSAMQQTQLNIIERVKNRPFHVQVELHLY